ncbi:hypothetical protein HYV49_01465 [Candidatus Pacearchaeota archaeon]|nr:hypothetical protein [Candidatus Pacearchaeota archaeon]
MTELKYHQVKLKKASLKDLKEAIKLAGELKEWFTKEALKNMKIDFVVNNLIQKARAQGWDGQIVMQKRIK